MIENIGRVASQLTFSVVAMGISTLLIQRTTVVHSFEQVPQAERASARFCPDDPWRLTVKNLSFISVQGLKVAYVYRGLPAKRSRPTAIGRSIPTVPRTGRTADIITPGIWAISSPAKL